MARRPSGFALIELIVTFVIVSVLAALSAGVVVMVFQMFIFLPSELKTRTIAQEAISAMVDGEPAKRGMRYSAAILDASATQFTYTFGYPSNSEKRNMRFQLTGNKIYRSYTAFGSGVDEPEAPYSTPEPVPYHTTSDMSVTGPAGDTGTIFTYFKSDGSAWVSGTDPLTAISRIEIKMTVRTGTGAFQSGQSSFSAATSVEIKNYI
jgi:prepilin-type N-terminal cleavage/methylation domain-containing protein